MTYPLLEQAPKDHNKTEFLNFLRENNKVVHENHEWLVIENCKYDKQAPLETTRRGEKRWHTAFLKSNQGWFMIQDNHWHALKSVMIAMGYAQWEMLIKRPHDRSVKRLHVHFIE